LDPEKLEPNLIWQTLVKISICQIRLESPQQDGACRPVRKVYCHITTATTLNCRDGDSNPVPLRNTSSRYCKSPYSATAPYGLPCYLAVYLYGHLPFCKPQLHMVLRYDCTRISGLLVGRICPGHNGLSARLTLIALACSLAPCNSQVLQTPVRPVCHQ